MSLCDLLTVPPPVIFGLLDVAVNTVSAVLAPAPSVLKFVVPCTTIVYVSPCTTSVAGIVIKLVCAVTKVSASCMFNLLCTIAAVGLTSWLIITSSLICISKYAVGLSGSAFPASSSLIKRLVVNAISLTGTPPTSGSSPMFIISWNGPLIYFALPSTAPPPSGLAYTAGAAAFKPASVAPEKFKLNSVNVAMSGPLVK